jgi:HAD superfamily hydrolase (TIGR01549 family)
MAISGVLFDFSGTLFRLSPDILDGLDPAHKDEVHRRLIEPTGPGDHLPPELSEKWELRDLDPAIHSEVSIATLRSTGLNLPDEQAQEMYRRFSSKDYWEPYPDTLAALKYLYDKKIPVGIVSNIAWDIRPMFDKIGALDYVKYFAFSFQHNLIKPSPEFFQLACNAIGVSPTQTLMIGDSPTADGGAAALGATVRIVPPLPVEQRPNALLDAIADL